MEGNYNKFFITVIILLLVLAISSIILKEKKSTEGLAGSGIKTLTGAVIFDPGVNCWDTTHGASQTACEADTECRWKSDPWGSWCEQKGCWNFYTQSECNDAINTLNISCSWQTMQQTGWCMNQDCWSFDGTNETACESNSFGLQCTWDVTDMPCAGPGEKNCWNLSTESTCEAVTGCKWGACDKVDCWDYSSTTEAQCESHTGYNGRACGWNPQYNNCYESGCWDYTNKTDCEAHTCSWIGGYCSQKWCSDFSYTNSTACDITANSTYGLSCTYDNLTKWCNDKGCWNYNSQNACTAASGCTWQLSSSTGWCNQVQCWNFERTNQTACQDSNPSNLDCVWNDPWCYEDVASKSCTGITNERNCMDTFYCFWNFTSSICSDPTGAFQTFFNEWNPGCYIFDTNKTICDNTSRACTWNASDSSCDNNANVIPQGELNCPFINSSTLCNSISMLSTCCKWQGSTCISDKFSTSCKDMMQEPPEGATYCEDYNSFTDQSLCNQIANSPWFMPCKWDNATERCQFNGDDVFGTGEKNVMKLDNKKNCEAAAGKWVTESYCEGTVAVSTGRCEMKFNQERTCDKECYACELKPDKTGWSSAAEAERECMDSAAGFCSFKADTSAPNGFGYCKPNDAFKKGLASGDCESDCSTCTYMGSPTASDQSKRPSAYCANSKAKCKWMADPANPTDESKGRCGTQAEKICEDSCDKCNDENTCKTYGAKKGNTTAEVKCKWESNECIYKSGADQMEICWNGKDDNGNNLMDCADSMCYSDPFCGGGFMGGKDCFGYTNEASCENNDCSWTNETWGAWCDMPGANCWKNDGNEGACTAAGCVWHSGFGGMCEDNFNKGASCTGKDKAACDAAAGNNCTWARDTWCQDFGGYCSFDYSSEQIWKDCSMLYTGNSAGCAADSACDWNADSWCQQQGADAGWCDHKSFTCWMYDNNQSGCQANSALCNWMKDPYSPASEYMCEGKNMGGSMSSGSCWSYTAQPTCEAASCSWISGLCDPIGFGGEMMPGMIAGGTGMAMGGSGMSCFKFNGNISGCNNQTGCGWFAEPRPFCDVNMMYDCPQYSYDNTGNACNAVAGCKWYGWPGGGGGYCDNKMFECSSNMTYNSNADSCNANSLCSWDATGSFCKPKCFVSETNATCITTGGANKLCRWVDGWCDPAMSAQFFGGMDMNPPIPLGTDADDSGIPDEVDIIEFGMKDMGKAFGFGITTDDFNNAAACNGVKMPYGMSYGKNTTKFYWYLDTDGNETNNCNSGNGLKSGFEFYLTYEASYDNSTDSAVETLSRYRCSDGAWITAEIMTSNNKQIMCTLSNGGMIAVDKVSLEKYPSLYNNSVDIRIYVESAGASGNSSNPTDYVSSTGYATAGAFDFDFDDMDMFRYETNSTKKAGKEGTQEGFVTYSEDADCWTQAGCSEYVCTDHPYCVENQYGVEAVGFTDKRTPKVIGVAKETYPDAAFLSYFTDKPANGTLILYSADSTCQASGGVSTYTFPDVGIVNNDVKKFKLWHIAELYSGATVLNSNGTFGTYNAPLAADTTYYFKVKVCDESGKCGESKCSSFKTEADTTSCPFCNFVTRVDAPTGWNVYFDLDQDGTYEHWQGNVCGANAGMKTNYTTGRRANIKLMTSDNETYMEFVNARLTKTGLSTNIRNITSSDSLKNGTTTTAEGATIGYAGMVEETRDKIINNLYPEKCFIRIPSTGSCNELWQCNSTLGNCVDRKTDAGVALNTTGSNYCRWQIPCEFSTWAGGRPGTPSGGGDSGDSGGSGGGSGAVVGGNLTGSTASYIYTGTINDGDKISFTIGENKFVMEVVYIQSDNIRINFKGYKYASIPYGKITNVDIDSDGKDDISIKATYLKEGEATVSIKQFAVSQPVEAPAPAAEEAAAEAEESPAEEKATGIAQPAESGAGKSLRNVVAGVVAVVALAMLAVLLILKKKKQQKIL